MNDSTAPVKRPPRALAIGAAGLAFAAILVSAAAPALAAPSAPESASGQARPARVTAKAPARAFFGLGPANATAIDGRPFFAWAATPGGVLLDHVAVVNFGAQPVTLQVFATNAVSIARGGTGFLSQGQARGGLASWIRLHYPHGSSALTLAPRTKVILPITLAVPRNGAPGDHVGAIVASLTSTAVSKNHAKIHLVQQVAARVVLRISGRLRPRLAVAGLRVTYDNHLNPASTGVATLHFTVQNTGNVLLGGKQAVSLHGLLGSTKTAPHLAVIPVMLPGGSDSESVKLTGVYPEFLMNAKVTISPIPSADQYDVGLNKYSGNASFVAVPWILLAVVVLILLIIGAWYRRRRRRRRVVSKPGGAAPVASEVGA